MTLQIDLSQSCIHGSGDHGHLVFVEPETDSDYASWPFHVDGEAGGLAYENVWTWDNPDDALEDVTLSPSLKYEGGIGPSFHVFVRDGEIEHCSDCECGCQ